MPRPALKCAVQVWETFETDPVDMYPWGSGMELDEVRGRAAAELGCDLDELVLTPSTTVSLNMVGEGLASTGFFSSASAPASAHIRSSSLTDPADVATIKTRGSWCSSSNDRILRTAVHPPITGMWISLSTASNFLFCSISRASLPFLAVTTFAPAFFRVLDNCRTIESISSTIRTVGFPFS